MGTHFCGGVRIAELQVQEKWTRRVAGWLPFSFVRVVYKCLMHSTVLVDAVTKVNEVGTFAHVSSGAGNVGHRSTSIDLQVLGGHAHMAVKILETT